MDLNGLSDDKVRFFVSMLLAFALGLVMRWFLHPSQTKTFYRQLFGLIAGLLLCFICHGRDLVHLLICASASYLLTKIFSHKRIHWIVLMFTMAHLSVFHYRRMVSNDYVMDVTGALMVLVQKISYYSLDLNDSYERKQSSEKTSSDSSQQTEEKKPHFFDYLSYCFHFPTVLAGPCREYKYYWDYISGSKEIYKFKGTVQAEPPSTAVALFKFITACFYLLLFMFASQVFYIHHYLELIYDPSTSFLHLLSYSLVFMAITRWKYYGAWQLADAASTAGGFGFSGFDTDGHPTWAGLSNFNILKVEFGTSLKEMLDHWNISTNRWLRRCMYERRVYSPTLLAFLLSAAWHGFYPGYYMTFISGALLVQVWRMVRRAVRPWVMDRPRLVPLYDIITTLSAVVHINVYACCFVLLDFSPSIMLWRRLFFIGHLPAFLLFVVLKLVPTRRSKAS